MPSRRERRRHTRDKPAASRAASPARPHTALTAWLPVESGHGRVRFVGVRRWWRWRRGEWGEWGMLYGLGSVVVLPVSAMLVVDALDYVGGQVWVSWGELVAGLVLLLTWVLGPVVAGLRPDVVWEAERGRLSLGRRSWARSELEAIEMVAGRPLDVWVHPKEGPPLRVARFVRGADEARRAIQQLGDLAGIVVRTRH